MLDYTILSSGNLVFEQHERTNTYYKKKCWGDPTITVIFGEKNIVVDPGYSVYREMEKGRSEMDIQMDILKLKMILLDLSISDIHLVFCTHKHMDHYNLVGKFVEAGARIAVPEETTHSIIPGVEVIKTPGHSENHHILKFNDGTYNVVVAGDAIINLDYYKELAPYWMNGYTDKEIMLTRESMYKISMMADIIIPGHGQPFMNDQPLKSRIKELWEKYNR